MSKAPWQKESAKGPLEELRRKLQRLSSQVMMDSGVTETRT